MAEATAKGIREIASAIVGEDGTEYNPNDQVKITVELIDDIETGNLRVVHLGDEITELDATTLSPPDAAVHHPENW